MLVSSTYFGNLLFWHTVAKEKVIRIDTAEHYQKQTFRNRTEILTANGTQALSVPVVRSNGRHSKMSEILISTHEDWQKDHWKSIESAYKHAPYFWYYGSEIRDMIFFEEKTLLNFNQHIIEKIINWLDLNITIENENDFMPLENHIDKRVLLNKKNSVFKHENYIQVFSEKISFKNNLSVIDALFNIGPLTRNLLTD